MVFCFIYNNDINKVDDQIYFGSIKYIFTIEISLIVNYFKELKHYYKL